MARMLATLEYYYSDPTVMPYAAIHNERSRAHDKHDANGGSMERRSFDDPMWLPVLGEEFGEVARVLCEADHSHQNMSHRQTAERLREELVQVAAMACAWIDAIDLEIW
jgi:hypothetical protein